LIDFEEAKIDLTAYLNKIRAHLRKMEKGKDHPNPVVRMRCRTFANQAAAEIGNLSNWSRVLLREMK